MLTKLRLTTVAHRDRDVAQKARILGSLNWTGAKVLAEFLFAKTRQFLKRRSQVARREGRLFRGRRLTIPRAHVLADIASKDMIAHRGAHLLRHRSMQFNREIGNAAAGSHVIAIGRDGLRRTSVDTARAGAATVRR